jgi:hypothetical protein
MAKVYVLVKQVYDEFDIIGICASESGAKDLLEQEKVYTEEHYPGCWEEGGWDQVPDWTNGGVYVKVRNGRAFKHWYFITEYDLNP